MQYEPLEDRVLIREVKKTEPEKTAGGIITDMVKKEVKEGEVVAVGQGYTARDTGTFIPTILHKGDIVLYGINAGMPIEIQNGNGKEECRLMRESDVLCLLKAAGKDSN
jgi:co-chaperonin GroES (HSP10)